jgi:hypothetical protein
MSARLLVAMIEPQDAVLFVGGMALSTLTVGDSFPAVGTYRGSKKSRTRTDTVSLTIDSLIVDGEPVDTVDDGTDVLAGLSGDGTALIEAANSAGWTRKRGRYLRSGQQALILEQT